MSRRTHRKHVSFPPAGDLFSVCTSILTLHYVFFFFFNVDLLDHLSSLQNGGEVMVVDANHELFSHVGIIGRRTQVIQVVSLLSQLSFRGHY